MANSLLVLVHIMAEPTKQETDLVFKVLKAHKANKVLSLFAYSIASL